MKALHCFYMIWIAWNIGVPYTVDDTNISCKKGNALYEKNIMYGLMTKEELEEEFEPVKGNKLYDDIDWVCELAELFKGK